MHHFPRHFTLALCFTALLPLTSQAHDLWLTVPPVAKGQPLHIEVGYGHDFPKGSPIKKDRQPLFEPVHLIGASGTVASFVINSENYRFTQKHPASGSYLALLNYKPTPWSVKTVSGKNQWKQADKKTVPDGFCMETTMQAKTVTFVGATAANDAITQPQGARLEFVPLVDPATLKTGDMLKVRLLAQGQPLKNHQVGIAFHDLNTEAKPHDHKHEHHHHDHDDKRVYAHPSLAHTYAYETATLKENTDASGVLSLPITQKGMWMLMSAYDTPYHDTSRCDIHLDNATFAFFIQ